jgi:hypothetical protein
MSALSLFLFTYGIWGLGVKKLAAQNRQREECALRDEKALVPASWNRAWKKGIKIRAGNDSIELCVLFCLEADSSGASRHNDHFSVDNISMFSGEP